MKKLLLPLLLFVFSACQSNPNVNCCRTPYDDPRGDRDAAYSQAVMKNTVKIREDLTVQDVSRPSSPDTPVSEGTFDTWFSGSGVVVKVDRVKEKSIILTAWHVCDSYSVGHTEVGLFATFKVVKESQVVVTVDNEELNFDVVYRDKDSDICLISVDEVLPSAARLADAMPPRGSFVDVVGSPKGTWGNYLVSMSRGQYFGLISIDVVLGKEEEPATKFKNFAYYGFAGIGGYSGSGIYYRGELVGIHTAGDQEYEHASYGPTITTIKKALKKAGY